MPTFARELPKADKRTRGRTAVHRTPVAIRSRVPLDTEMERDIRARLAKPLARLAPRIERATVRFEDVSGARGATTTRCRIKVVLSGHNSVVLEQRAASWEQALGRAVPRLLRAVDKQAARAGGKTPAVTRRSTSASTPAVRTPKRRATTPRRRAAAPKRRAQSARTARTSPPKRKRRGAGMVVVAESSRGKKSRKSTRRSANRTKAGNKLGRRTKRKLHAPRGRHRRGK